MEGAPVKKKVCVAEASASGEAESEVELDKKRGKLSK